MGRNKKMPGLIKRGNVWHINKIVDGRRICESTGASDLLDAEKYLIRRLEVLRQAEIYGVRPKRSFRDAGAKYVLEHQHKRTLKCDAEQLKLLDPVIGKLALSSIHMGTLQPFIEMRKAQGVKNRTINYSLQVIRRILNLAAHEWIDELGMTWLESAPKIKLLPENDARQPYPLAWKEQDDLFHELASHMRDMALFAVNTGCRDREVCRLRWEWEVKVDHPDIISLFVIPQAFVKNNLPRLIVLNRLAREIVEQQRGKHPTHVFQYRGQPLDRMLNSSWKKARKKINLPLLRVHDLRHTFGARLRAAGVSFEDRQDLLGHKSSRITTHYSAAELTNLWLAVNKICEPTSQMNILLAQNIHLKQVAQNSSSACKENFRESLQTR